MKSPPDKGKANEELKEILAEYFKAKKAQIKIKTGMTSRNKIIEVNQ